MSSIPPHCFSSIRPPPPPPLPPPLLSSSPRCASRYSFASRCNICQNLSVAVCLQPESPLHPPTQPSPIPIPPLCRKTVLFGMHSPPSPHHRTRNSLATREVTFALFSMAARGGWGEGGWEGGVCGRKLSRS